MAGVQVRGDRELGDALIALMTDPVRRARLGAAARALVEANRGAKEKSLAVLRRCFRRSMGTPSPPTFVPSGPLLDSVYARVASARRRWYERHPEARRRLRQPVISVGNLSVGGTGKTPLIAQLAQWLLAQGERPAILSRGYGREDAADGVVVVSDGQSVRASISAHRR